MTTTTPRRSAWDAIVQRALLGTDRTPASASAADRSALGAVLARVDSSDAERALLSAAAFAGAYEAAGRLPARMSSTPVSPAIPELDDLPTAPARVARFLVTMLGGVNDEVLPEWLAAVAARRWRVPTPLLPALLEAGRKNTALRDAIAPALGARGHWLASRNEDWRYAIRVDAPADEAAIRRAWETGTRDERRALLEDVRARDRTLGRALVESTWADDHPSVRTTFLTVLGANLGPDDEPLLEHALDDRRQEVRHGAADLLRGLPGSALVARMTARAQAALDWKPGRLLKRGEIIVTPPATLDDASVRDGILSKPPAGMGERAWWLAQIVGAVPPATWSGRWKATPDALLAAAAASEWAQALMDGWAVAALRNRDAAWAEALLGNGFPGERPTTLSPNVGKMVRVLPIERREAFIARAIREHPGADMIVVFVDAADHPWSDVFARTVVAWMRRRVAAAAAKAGAPEWLLRETLPRTSLRLPPTLPSLTDGWPTGEDAANWSRALERFLSTLTFRRELHEELER